MNGHRRTVLAARHSLEKMDHITLPIKHSAKILAVVASLLLNIWAQLLIVAAIVFAVITKTENIYTHPEFSMPHDDPLHLRHIYGHLTFVIGAETLFGAAVGCLLLWLLRTLVPMQEDDVKTRK